MKITKPGLFFDVPCEDYFADPCPEPSLSNSGIGILLNQSPLHFAAQHPRLVADTDQAEQIVRDASAAMCVGSVVHRLALGAGKDYEIIDAADFRKNETKAIRDDAIEAGKVPILKHQFEKAEAQAKVVRQHLDDVLMGEPFIPEVVLAWQTETKHGLIWCRGMIDAWCPTLLTAVDLKSTTDASPVAATRRMVNGGYDTQDAWYSRGLGHVTDQAGRIQFVTLFVENDPPFASHAVTINEAWRTSAWDLCEEAADIFGSCLKARKWPGYPRTPQLLSPPDWLISQRMFRGFARDGHAELDDSPFTTTDEGHHHERDSEQAVRS
jgi:hypothetical protein